MKTKINPAFCKGCNICVYICPKKCYEKSTDLSELGYFIPRIPFQDKCFNHGRKKGERLVCELCVLSCPDQAISWIEEEH